MQRLQFGSSVIEAHIEVVLSQLLLGVTDLGGINRLVFLVVAHSLLSLASVPGPHTRRKV
jgi:hypothetical protein